MALHGGGHLEFKKMHKGDFWVIFGIRLGRCPCIIPEKISFLQFYSRFNPNALALNGDLEIMRSVRCFDWFILLWCHWTNLGLLPKWQLWATFFISIIKIISIIGLICIMIQCKMLLLNQWLQKKWPISNLCSGQIKRSLLILYLSSASLIKVFPPSVCPSVRPSVRRAVQSSLANRYIIDCSSYNVHICIWRISPVEIRTWVTLTYFCRSYRSKVTLSLYPIDI